MSAPRRLKDWDQSCQGHSPKRRNLPVCVLTSSAAQAVLGIQTCHVLHHQQWTCSGVPCLPPYHQLPTKVWCRPLCLVSLDYMPWP